MTWKKLQRVLACLLAVLLLSQVGAFLPAARAAGGYELQNGTAIIKSTMTTDEVNHALTRALVKDFDQMSEEEQNTLLDSLTWEYYCEGKEKKAGVLTHSDWGKIDGFESTHKPVFVTYTYTHPALAANKDGDYKVRLVSTKQEVTLTKAEKLSSSITLKQGASVKLPYKEDGTLDFDALRAAILQQVVDEGTTPALTTENTKIEYYASSALVDHKEWVKLEGEYKTIPFIDQKVGYPAISEGNWKIKITFNGNADYKGCSREMDVTFLDREAAPFHLKTGVTEVGIVYNADQSIDYEATAQALREALIESTDSSYPVDLVKVEYNIYGTAITDDLFANYKDLSYKVLDSDLFNGIKAGKFGLGDQVLRLSWRGNAGYKPFEETRVQVKMVDNRQPAEVVLKPSISLVYNMDASVMEQNIFEYVIDWDDSKLPDKSTLSADDFTIEYYATAKVVAGDFSGDMDSFKGWVPIEGKRVTIGELQLLYPQMGAGEQKIRVTYNGNADYSSSDAAEANLTVKKAKVSVKVHSTSIYADEAPGKDFVTTDPADKFDIFTIYTGVSSVFVQLPERFTDNAFIKAVDPVLEKAGLRTIKDIMDKGITVGELKQSLDKIVNGDEYAAVREVLKLMGIDVTTLQQIINVFNKITLLDKVRIALRTPDQVGIYTVYAITNNDNYNTGFGMGALVVKKHYSGVKLTWNQNFTNGKLTQEEAKDFDFGATLSYNGKQVEDQSSVHYLYSGFTSKWKPYSSTTAPTEPGRYVMTVVTLGGNYQAAPMTRSFQITK